MVADKGLEWVGCGKAVMRLRLRLITRRNNWMGEVDDSRFGICEDSRAIFSHGSSVISSTVCNHNHVRP